MPHLMFELGYLAFEVTDVLAWVCVVQLALDLSFFFLLAEDMNITNQKQADFWNMEGSEGSFASAEMVESWSEPNMNNKDINCVYKHG